MKNVQNALFEIEKEMDAVDYALKTETHPAQIKYLEDRKEKLKAIHAQIIALF